MREEFEKQLINKLLAKFEIKTELLEIDCAIKKNGLGRLCNIKKILLTLKQYTNKQILLLLILKTKLLQLVHT